MTQILDHRGQPIEKSVLAEPQTSRLAWLKREFQEHPSRNLTPAKLARILEEAEQGDILRQNELWEDMTEKDGHLFAEMSKRERALLTVEWDIEPPTNASAQEKKDAEALKELVAEVPDLEDVFLGMAAAVGPAYSCQEIEWERMGATWLPKKIESRPQTWFTLDRETRSRILLRDLGVEGVELLSFGWIAHVHRAKPGYLARAGLMRQLSWPYIFKIYAVGDLAEFLEIHGLPLRVGTYPPNAGKEEKATLLQAVTSIGHDAAGIIPEGMKIDFKEASDSNHEPFLGLVELMERTASKVILGATLTSQADGKTSTNALGKVHNDVRLDILTADARQIEATLKRDLIRPLGLLNGLIRNDARCPKLRFDVQEEEDFQTMAETIKVIVDMGLKVPAPWAREMLGVPEPAAGEEVLERQAPPTTGEMPPAGAAKPARPGKPKGAAANLAALAAALQQREPFPDQAALDAAIAALDPAELQLQAEEFMAPIIDLIRASEDPQVVMTELAHRYPAMSTERLEQFLERAWFVSELWGRIADQGNA